jgi:hypothetical protein
MQRKGRARGAVLVEYALLLVAVAIPAAAGMLAGGVAMYKEYKSAKSAILAPMP